MNVWFVCFNTDFQFSSTKGCNTIDFVQYIDKPTHNSGHLLDYIITRKDSSGVSNLYVSDFICDHRALHVSLTCSRAHPERKQIEVRSLKRIQCDVREADYTH